MPRHLPPLLHSRGLPILSALIAAFGGACSRAAWDTAGDEKQSVAPVSSCAAPAPAAAARVVADVVYVRRGGRELTMDLILPTGNPAPVVVLLHGGSWSGGAPASLRHEAEALARLGYAAALVEYRLTNSGENLFPAAVADVRCAVRFLRANAVRLGIRENRIAAAGYSAGGHLASMLGAAAHVGELDEACTDGGAHDVAVHAVISYAGPTDLRVRGPYTQEQADIVTNFLGIFPGDDPRRAELASPLAHVRGGAPPSLFVHGVRDELVPVEHSRWMTEALHRVGTPATVLELQEHAHEFVGLATSANDRVRCTVQSFLDRWLRA